MTNMKSLKLITTDQYANMPEGERAAYDLVVKSIKPGKKLWVKNSGGFDEVMPKHAELWDFPYADMIAIKSAFAGFEGVELMKQLADVVYGIHNEQFNLISYLNVAVGFFPWVFEEFEEIISAENNHLDYTPDEKEKSAGIDNLSDFGHFPAIDSLAGGDITKHDEILKMPYHMVFQKLAYQHTVNQIQKKLIENAGK